LLEKPLGKYVSKRDREGQYYHVFQEFMLIMGGSGTGSVA